jgi:aerobic-type carbon monoxide dehydrogenase small subunit (CoxS/CutS family)
MDPVRFLLDGEELAVERDLREPALDALREEGGALACKQGCAPQALCGCCAVLVDGRPRLACTLPLRGVAGRSVQTARSVPHADVIARCLAASGASACGYCTPGMLVSAAALLAADTSPDETAIQRALALHLCRCTGYAPLLEGVRLAARVLRGEVSLPDVSADAVALARGERLFTGDLARAGMLHGAVVLAPRAGVIASVTLPVAEGLVGVVLRRVGDPVAAGEPVAAVACGDRRTARAHAAQAMVEVVARAGAVVVFEEERVVGVGPQDAGMEPALRACETLAERGIAFEATDAAPLEPEAAFACPAEDGDAVLHVHSPGEDAAAEAHALAAALGVSVRVTPVPSGGSYGARRSPGVQEAAGALALASARAVSVVCTHEESVLVRPKRPAVRVTVRLGVRAGVPAALDVAVDVDGAARCLHPEVLLEDAWAACPPVPVMRVRVRVTCSDGAGDAVRCGRTAPMRGAMSLPVGVAWAAALAHAGLDPGDRCPAALRDALGSVPLADGTEHTGLAWAPATPAGAPVRVEVDRSSARAVVRAEVPELGEGHAVALRAGIADALRLAPADIVVGTLDGVARPEDPCAPTRARWPDGDALRAAARAAAGGMISDAVDPGGDAAAGCLARVELDGEGRVLAVRVVGEGGHRVLEGAAAMGVGRVLVEEVPRRADGSPDTRLRGLGIPKLRHAPRVHGISLRDVAWGDADAAHVAAAAAMFVALARCEGTPREAVPARGSAAARQLGVRPRAVAGDGSGGEPGSEGEQGESRREP